MRIFIASCLLFGVVTLYSYSREEVLDYIEQYKSIAVEEMQNYGIPASIKMAQAILESSAGTSDLALEANNHFGIKCGGAWKGSTYYLKDDDYDSRGRLIKSCFRVYSDPEESFRAHSQFLLDPNKEYRYGSLFTLEVTDYKSWAWGLSKAGYATNPAYANLLIYLIENYSLNILDYYEESNVRFVKRSDLIVEPREVDFSEKLDQNNQNTFFSHTGEPLTRQDEERQMEINNLDVLRVSQGQTMERLAQEYDLTPMEILSYNDNNLDLDDHLEEGMYIYLEKKRIWFHGSKRYHTVRKGEDLKTISQLYGIRLATLVRKNKIDGAMVPLPGEIIKLRGLPVQSDEIPLTYNDVEIQESNEVSEPVLAESWLLKNPHMQTEIAKNDMAETDEIPVDPVFDLSKDEIHLSTDPSVNKKTKTKSNVKVKIYRVVKGDTLYGISRRFGVTIDSILHHNQLSSDHIQIGQKLKIIK